MSDTGPEGTTTRFGLIDIVLLILGVAMIIGGSATGSDQIVTVGAMLMIIANIRVNRCTCHRSQPVTTENGAKEGQA